MFSLSICLIVKNEEEVLERCLQCCNKFADEIIVVDTGSADNTIEIAKKYTKNIFSFTWNDNFADARNFSFSKASKDYIMWLDADDIITDENIEKILLLKKSNTNTDVFMCKYLMAFDNLNKPNFTFFRERILKRSKNFKWEGFVHEAICPSGKIEYTTIEIEHRKEKQSNPNRNLDIYKKALKKGITFSTREQYYYSRELYYHKDYKGCIRELKKYLKMKDQYLPNIIEAHSLIAECNLVLKQPNTALKSCFEAIKVLPTPEICCLTAKCFEEVKQYDNAIFWYECSQNCPTKPLGFVKENYKKLVPYIALTKLYFDKGEVNKSYHYHNLAKKENPKHPSIIFNDNFFKSYFKN